MKHWLTRSFIVLTAAGLFAPAARAQFGGFDKFKKLVEKPPTDTIKEKIGRRSRGGVVIYDVREFRKVVKRESVQVAVIAVPAASAQHVVNIVVTAGVKAILNFSPGAIKVPRGVKLKSLDLTVSLESLSFFLAQGETGG